jgi:hypothetical protein
MNQILNGEARLYQGVLIQYQSYHNDYVCSYGGVAMLPVMGQMLVLECLLSGARGCL